LTAGIDNIIIDMIDVENSAAEALLEGRRRQANGRRENSDSSGDGGSGWSALTACFGLSQCLANLILCFGGQ
jgi:hypothetical protein